ncbi:glycoside hydrolase family 3 N-terminal domain-containing protein [Yonghaparkia sp. Root332]|uniref:glycoside hydrolase family 3 N-terminal domain-containing protein n=1 Tax=Yonghaparkia sp. Root332 TaxID=1736516 RepID=UPI0009E9A6EC|nr:glycoside hydrolase family 3 N-terminal domain-containing protein [Yonghaparkia sp. Root332]
MRRPPTTLSGRSARVARPGIRRGLAALALLLAASTALAACGAAPEASPVLRGVSAPPAADPTEINVAQRIASMSLEQKVAALVMVHVPGTDPAAIRSVVDGHGLGGVILMGDNVAGDVAATRALTSALSSDPGLPLLTAIDQEGGVVARLPGDVWPAGRALQSASPEEVEGVFAARAGLVESAGVLVNFGIVADIEIGSGSFIGPRTLGETPEAAAERVAAAVRGEQGRALSTLKHFPGHGASPDDSHVSIPTSSLTLAQWRATHAVPFAAGIEAGAPLVMTGHLRFDSVSPLPASLSPTWIRILRDELGFDGVIVTDDLLMLQRSGDAHFGDPIENGVRALAAGNDLLLYVLPGDPASVGFDVGALVDALVAAVTSGRVDEEAVDDSLRRVLALRRAASAETGPFSDCGLKCVGLSPRARPAD